MINNNISYCLTLTFWVKSLLSKLHSSCGTWLRCNFLEWGAPERSTRGTAKRGSGSAGDAATAFRGARIPLRGHTFLRKALLRPARSHHSASLRLALYPKNRTLHLVQLPDLGLIRYRSHQPILTASMEIEPPSNPSAGKLVLSPSCRCART